MADEDKVNEDQAPEVGEVQASVEEQVPEINEHTFAYIGVDPVPDWQYPPINTQAEVEALIENGTLPPLEGDEPEVEPTDEESDGDAEAKADENDAAGDAPAAPVAESEENDGNTVVTPGLL